MRLSVVVPCYNEEGNLAELHRRLAAVLPTTADDWELILVDDGSTDGTLAAMRRLSAADPHVRYVSFSRNFGHEAASTAGLDRADGDCVVLMDADLQDPPEVIPDLVAQWRAGYEEVHAVRRRRHGTGPLKRATAFLFYRLINTLSEVPLPPDTGDFRLMDRRVVADFRRCRERARFVRGLVSWVGYRQGRIVYDRPARQAGETKYHFRNLFPLAMDVVIGFSTRPLHLASHLGLLVTLASFIIAVVVVVQQLFFGHRIPGYTLSTAGLFFLGGVQMLLLGIIGEYLGRVYRQVQERPLYLVREEGGAAALCRTNQGSAGGRKNGVSPPDGSSSGSDPMFRPPGRREPSSNAPDATRPNEPQP
jgi:glycosyltransferase involved in cell wall biosynthesis